MQKNVVLYRKYRPQAFSEVFGQEHITKTLVNSIANKSMGHAYLFCGPKGSGKTSIARIFAKSINCIGLQQSSKKSTEPCNKCSSCLEIISSRSLDVLEIDAASHTGVDQMRSLVEGIAFSPVSSQYKVSIIDECHQLSKSASNALLKTLEEPPSHAIFILATTEPHKMIPTIISRCQRFDFKKLQNLEIIKKLEFILEKEGISYESSVLPIIALNARGSFRDAESLLDKCISFSGKNQHLAVDEVKSMLGIVDVKGVSDLLDLMLSGNTKEAIRHVHFIIESGADPQEFIKTFIFYMRQLLLMSISTDKKIAEQAGFSNQETEIMIIQATKTSNNEIKSLLEVLIESEHQMKYATILLLPLEIAIISFTSTRQS
jgi:DNA polymerase III subunit gamma/tau